MNRKCFKTRLKSILKQIGLLLSLIWSYLPIIAGILVPMMIILPIIYSSWFFFSICLRLWWFDAYIYFWYNKTIGLVVVVILESIIFSMGIFLFLSGLYHLAKGRKNDILIVNTGLYKHIRHPQNFGLIMLALPFALYIPGFNDIGIRLGEIYSWLLFSFILSIYSNLEESYLSKKIPDEYKTYLLQTGFFLPRLHLRKKDPYIKNEFMTCRKRYFFLIVLFILSFLAIYYIFIELGKYLGWRYIIYL